MTDFQITLNELVDDTTDLPDFDFGGLDMDDIASFVFYPCGDIKIEYITGSEGFFSFSGQEYIESAV